MEFIYLLNPFMEKMALNYAVCGGHAIDLFVGRRTRPHKDLDIAVFEEDRDKIVSFMLDAGWDVLEPCGCKYLHKIEAPESQKKIKKNIWCVKPSNPHYRFREHKKGMYAVKHDSSEQKELDFIEFLFNKRTEDRFLYARDCSIGREMEKAVLECGSIKYLAPEIVLLYKSTAYKNKEYQSDFDAAAPLLNAESRHWLRNALAVGYPQGHIWQERL